jgi:hypothetical protein
LIKESWNEGIIDKNAIAQEVNEYSTFIEWGGKNQAKL